MDTNEEKVNVKKEKIVSCRYLDKYLNQKSQKFNYTHEVITDEGAVLNINTMDKNSIRIKVGATIEYVLNDKNKAKLISSSNDASKIAENALLQKAESEKIAIKQSNRIKGQETFLGYAWSYAKDLIIAGKTMKDVDELNKVARFIYNEIGEMLKNE